MDEIVTREAGSGSLVAIAALVIWSLVSVMKSSYIPIDIPPRVRPWLAFGLGQTYAVLVVVLRGEPAGHAIVEGLLATVMAIGGQELGASVRVPPSVPPAMLLLFSLTVTGCAGATAEVARYAEASRDILAAAEPCLVAQQTAQLEACKAEAACEARIVEAWAPIKQALNVAHDVWCSLAPESEGCAK